MRVKIDARLQFRYNKHAGQIHAHLRIPDGPRAQPRKYVGVIEYPSVARMRKGLYYHIAKSGSYLRATSRRMPAGCSWDFRRGPLRTYNARKYPCV